MKVIFLDFDGVLTTPSSNWELIPDNIKILQELINDTGAKVVLTTSWRSDTVEHSIKQIKENAYNPEHICPVEESIVGVTPYIGDRGLEILFYLTEHSEIENYVIIDDDNFCDSDSVLYKHLVLTDVRKGITVSNLNKAIKILS